MIKEKIKRILIIDDSTDDQELLKSYLEDVVLDRFDLDVQCSGDIYSSMALLAAGDFQLCFMDYQLGSVSGLEMVGVIKSLEIETPIIFVTGHGSGELAKEAFDLGVVDYFPKSALNSKFLTNSLVEIFS